MSYIYEIHCDNSSEYVVSNKPLPDFTERVGETLRKMPFVELTGKNADWFGCIVDRFCEYNECTILRPLQSADVEEWHEEVYEERRQNGETIKG